MTASPRRPCATCLAAACASVLERPTTKVSNVRRGSSGEPPSASCTAEIGADRLRSSLPLPLCSRTSRGAAGASAGLLFGGKVLMTAERTVSSMRRMLGCSACQQASTFSA